jgi:threonine dehydrogenase-like Zn-dependent dehydrogenase
MPRDQSRVAVLYGPGQIQVESVDPSPLGPSDVALKVAISGICGTDLHYWDGWEFDAWFPEKPGPWVPGHEFTAVVRSVGTSVDGLAPGDHVVIEPNLPCEDCPTCDRGLINFCPSRRQLPSGGWADQVVLDRHHIVPLPDGTDVVTASLTEPLSCVLRGFDRVQITPGDTIFVAGAGPIGLLALLVAKQQQAGTTVLSEPIAARRAVAAELGADHILNPTTDDVKAVLQDLTDGFGADLAIESAGANPAFAACLAGVRDTGTILVLSVGNPSTTFPLRPFDFFAHELTIVGSNTRVHTFHRALEMIPALGAEPIITHTFGLESAEQAIKTAKSGQGAKVVFDLR